MTKSLQDGIKVVILDEQDGTSAENQRALRNTMEEYAENTRFILTANYKHKIIPAIHSRCIALPITYDIADVVKRCWGILQKENVKISTEQKTLFVELVKKQFPDIRSTINALQLAVLNGTLNIRELSVEKKLIETICALIKKDVVEAREYTISNEQLFQGDYHFLLKELLEYVYKSKVDVLQNKVVKSEVLLTITEHMYRHSFVIDTEINYFACTIAINKILNK